jgi:hypothetical protein
MDDFEGQYAHGFSITLDPGLCGVGLKEPSAVGFRVVSDTLLFYSMVQGHLIARAPSRARTRFDNCGLGLGTSTSGHGSFEFREGDTDKSPALPKQIL